MSRSADIRYLCALVACMPDWLRREPYLGTLAAKTRTPEPAIRREVDALARGGQAVDLARRYVAGQEIPAVAHRSAASVPAEDGEPVGWWNRGKGETEDEFEFIYRTRYRLQIASHLTEWERLTDWLDRAAEHLDEWGGWPWNEIRAYHQIAAEHLADPVSREAHELRHGVTLYEEDEDHAILAALESALLDTALSRGWDWWEMYEESVADGIPPELAAAKLIGLADR